MEQERERRKERVLTPSWKYSMTACRGWIFFGYFFRFPPLLSWILLGIPTQKVRADDDDYWWPRLSDLFNRALQAQLQARRHQKLW